MASSSGGGTSAAAGSESATSGSTASGADTKRSAARPNGVQARPIRFAPSSKKQRRGTVLVFRLSRPAQVLVSVYGPGPSCERLGTFHRRGRPGVNLLPVSGSLFGRALPPGRYAILVEAVRRGERILIGRVLVTILSRDGREGGNRRLVVPACGGQARAAAFLASAGGDFDSLTSLASGPANGTTGAGARSSGAGGVAGVSAGRGEGDGGESLLPQLPALPAIPSLPLADSLDVPPWTLPALAILGALGAAALAAFGFRRYRENAGGGWD